jgi:uncharacterized membrane protein
MAVLQVLLGFAYPALIYLALTFMEPRAVAICVLLLLAARVAMTSPKRLLRYASALRLAVLGVTVALLISAACNDPVSLRATPALVSFALLIAFAYSLTQSESIIEAYARVVAGDLPEEERLYCRRVTLVWCGFFLVNGCAALWLAVAGTLEQWALYTGGIAYVMMGILFASEYIYRHWRFRRYLGAPTDPVLRRIFPPRSTSQ